MDYTDAIKQAYEHIENNRIDQAVMSCLRISRNLHDYLYTAIFLREMNVSNKDFFNVLMDDGSHLDKDAVEFLSETSLNYYINIRVFDFGEFSSDGEEKNVLSYYVYELDEALEQSKLLLNNNNLPKDLVLKKISAIQQLKYQIKMRCFNYLTRIELRLQAQNKSQNFLEKCHNKDIEWFKTQNLALATRPVIINNQATVSNEIMNQLSDQSQKIGNLNIEATNSVINLRDIIGQVTNTINQIPESSESEKLEIKELLKELQAAIDDPTLVESDKKEVLEQIQSLAEAAQDPKNETMQKKAKKAVGFLKVISEGLEPAGKVVTTIKSIIPAILAFFGA
jgi:hypothetical protein